MARGLGGRTQRHRHEVFAEAPAAVARGGTAARPRGVAAALPLRLRARGRAPALRLKVGGIAAQLGRLSDRKGAKRGDMGSSGAALGGSTLR